MRVHLVGVSGTGMGQLALLFRDAGHDVSGSDMAFDPPMGPALESAGIRCLKGYDAAHIDARSSSSSSATRSARTTPRRCAPRSSGSRGRACRARSASTS